MNELENIYMFYVCVCLWVCCRVGVCKGAHLMAGCIFFIALINLYYTLVYTALCTYSSLGIYPYDSKIFSYYNLLVRMRRALFE